MTENQNNDADQHIVINLADTADLRIESLDIGVADGVLSFDISGTITNMPDDQLDDLRGKELTPTELAFTVADAA